MCNPGSRGRKAFLKKYGLPPGFLQTKSTLPVLPFVSPKKLKNRFPGQCKSAKTPAFPLLPSAEKTAIWFARAKYPAPMASLRSGAGCVYLWCLSVFSITIVAIGAKNWVKIIILPVWPTGSWPVCLLLEPGRRVSPNQPYGLALTQRCRRFVCLQTQS